MAREKALILQTEIPPDLPLTMANRHRIDQVMSNLLDNAIKYTPEGTITVRAEADDHQITVYVTDSGIGLTPQEQKELFNKFYRARNKYTKSIEGTGLGLAIARSIIEQTGGTIWVQSAWDRGSTFAFSLPIEHRD
jgi:signal transduction histidine kinase